MRVVFVFQFLLGAAWIAKGVLHLMRGRGSDYWSDDFLYGGLILVVGMVGWLRLTRQAKRADDAMGE
jgi:hypothetical protein